MDIINLTLLIAMTGLACVTVFLKDLVRAALGLAFMSALLAVLLFRLNSPYAAVFELSVVAGLITVLFVSVIALTKEDDEVRESRWPLYLFPLVLVVFGLIDVGVMRALFISYQPAGSAAVGATFGTTLWGLRSLDMLGQVAVIFGGVFGVLALLREKPLTVKQRDEAEKAKDGGEKLW